MSDNSKRAFLNDGLSKRTSIFGLRLWVVLGIGVGAAIVLILFLLSLLCFTLRRNLRRIKNAQQTTPIFISKPSIPNVSKEIIEIRLDNLRPEQKAGAPDPVPDSGPVNGSEQRFVVRPQNDDVPCGQQQRIHIEIGKDHRISYPERVTGSSSHGSGEQMSMALVAPEVSHLGWGHWYTLRELEGATNDFADKNVIGEGGYGIVYRGVLDDHTQVAVKNLLNNRGQAEKEFKVEVEAIGRVRHKNLVRLLGYCAEGAHRILVYEYVDNGNLEQWLHGDVGPFSPLTWDIRMNIMIGTAKGFGILLMEIISGRCPVDYSRPPAKVSLVDWLKQMVSNRNAEGVLDAKLPEKPSSRALKRVLLVALRCVDPNSQKRPKMGHVVHMLEAEELPLREDHRIGQEHGHSPHSSANNRLMDKRAIESGDSSSYESGTNIPRLAWRKPETVEEN